MSQLTSMCCFWKVAHFYYCICSRCGTQNKGELKELILATMSIRTCCFFLFHPCPFGLFAPARRCCCRSRASFARSRLFRTEPIRSCRMRTPSETHFSSTNIFIGARSARSVLQKEVFNSFPYQLHPTSNGSPMDNPTLKKRSPLAGSASYS